MRRQWLERLEARRLLAASGVFDAATQTLIIRGTEQADTLNVQVYGDGVFVYNESLEFFFDNFPIEHLRIESLGGADVVQLYVTHGVEFLSQSVELGEGDDRFTASAPGVTVLGGAGNDTITGTNYRDLILGGDGDDSLDGSASIDTVDGGAGNDTARDDRLDSLIAIEHEIAQSASAQVTADGTLLILGTDGPDNIDVGSPGGIYVYVNDVAFAVQETSDLLFPSFQQIEIRGLGGDDTFFVGETYPYPLIILDGGDGNDYFELVDRAAAAIGGPGDDVATLLWSAVLQGFDGGSGVDTIIHLIEGTGYFEGPIVGVENRITQHGAIFDQRYFTPTPYADPWPVVDDGNGNATLTGTDGPDEILIYVLRPRAGPAAYAVINGVPHAIGWSNMTNGTLTVLGKGGHDRIEMRASGVGVRAYFDGGDGNDTLIGGSYNDILIGGSGKDLFFARDGVADIIDGGQGNDKAEADAVDELIDVKGKKAVKVKKS